MHTDNTSGHYILLASCPLQKGVAAKLTQFVYDSGSEIVDYDQYIDVPDQHFYCRMEWTANTSEEHQTIKKRFTEQIAQPLQLHWKLRIDNAPFRLAIYVTRELEHLYSLIMKCLS